LPQASFQSLATLVRRVENVGVRVQRTRDNVFQLSATAQELSALIAGARLALDVMRSAPAPSASAIELLERVLGDFDRSRERLFDPPPGGDQP
jgi:hypothetical protein